jgi:hypothetical protein
MFDRILMGIIAACMVLYLLPLSTAGTLALMLIVAISLIALLVMRGFAWHGKESPYDVAIIIAIFLTFVHLFTFSAFDQSTLSIVATVLFAVFFALTAALMQEHQILRARTYNITPVQGREYVDHSPDVPRKAHDHAHDPQFMRGIEPIPERAPPHHVPKLHHRVRAAVRHVFRPRVQPLPELHPAHIEPLPMVAHTHPVHDASFRKGIAPIPEVKTSAPAKQHAPSFKKGIEPIHEITPAHLHKLGVYDLEPKPGNQPKKASK